MTSFGRALLALLLLASAPACRHARSAPADGAREGASVGEVASTPRVDPVVAACRERARELESAVALPGAPEFERQRIHILGRARGEPVLWLREPRAASDDELDEDARQLRRQYATRAAFSRVEAYKRRFRGVKTQLRALLLREHYLYSADPIEALALVERLSLAELFDEPRLSIERGAARFEVSWDASAKRYVDDQGREARLLLADRVVVDGEEPGPPLHRDVRGLARQLGFERMQVERITESGVLSRVKLDGVWARAVLGAQGARLELTCFDEPAETRRLLERHVESARPRLRALDELRRAVDRALDEGLPFDRPREEPTADRDGQLRPAWRAAYLRGARGFSFEEASYPVYDRHGRPRPPQVCVDFVLESYERAQGTWFAPSGETPARRVGTLDFDAHGITNRRGVLALEQFATAQPDLFDHERVPPAERVPFAERARFFGSLVDSSRRFSPGDVVAIQGLKSDGKVHQHAILIEDIDTLTGFPDALADQMRLPRRRTWEGIMAEAPRRSLLYRLRPRSAVLPR
ncbi:MAG: hypothetical protein KF718_16630 [Polyangiaceae bacterium]|nr:hypothetical protein [Polyangiaceae bacterium]